jgi:hypothetical protein
MLLTTRDQGQTRDDRKSQHEDAQPALVKTGMRDPARQSADRQAGKQQRRRSDLPQRQPPGAASNTSEKKSPIRKQAATLARKLAAA